MAKEFTPVYPHSPAYAVENGEKAQSIASYREDIACKAAIEEAINENDRDSCIDTKTALHQVADRFGMERTTRILAITVREKENDGRISRTNKAWAKTVAVAESHRNRNLVIDQAHPGLVDLFINRVRSETQNLTAEASLSSRMAAAAVKAEQRNSAGFQPEHTEKQVER